MDDEAIEPRSHERERPSSRAGGVLTDRLNRDPRTPSRSIRSRSQGVACSMP
jgi:hypothetical protein